MKSKLKTQIFDKVILTAPKRNTFDLSHDRKFSANLGYCYPVLCEEVYPSEHWSIDGQSLVRTAPMVAPMMHQVNIYKHYFFVPNRILWPNWDLFITGGDKFNSEAAIPVPPYVVIPEGGFAVGSIPDYLGFPTGSGAGTRISAFPFAYYLRTHQEYYRDENLGDTELLMLIDGDNTTLIVEAGLFGAPFARAYERDYFTSCLPEPQKGPEVTIPLGESAPIVYSGLDLSVPGSAGRTTLRQTLDGNPPVGPGSMAYSVLGEVITNGPTDSNIDISTTHYTDLSSATSATVNSWRLAMAVQRLYERFARGGSRTIEFLRAVWNSRASSSRLDRPEYFGGAKEPLSVSEVLQTSETAGTPQGNMSGHGIAVARINSSTYDTTEYGGIIGIFSVLPKTAYQQGIRKSWTRLTDRFDYFWPDLAHIGEQPVLNKELWLDTATDVRDDETFGYLPYGTELRYINDSVHGEFRSTQDFWHMGRIFETRPLLNESFVMSGDNVTRRVFADLDPSTDTLYCHLYHRIIAKRCIPLFGSPS